VAVPRFTSSRLEECGGLRGQAMQSRECRLPRLIADRVRAAVEALQVVVEVANELEMRDVLPARPQRVRQADHVELPVGVVPLLHDVDQLGLVVAGRVFPDIREALVDLHVDGMQRDVVRVCRHVHQDSHLDRWTFAARDGSMARKEGSKRSRRSLRVYFCDDDSDSYMLRGIKRV